MKKASIKDIAREAGVSLTTVSIVLNGQGKERKISERMIAQITGLADKLNYRPNQFAKSLRTGKTFTLGLIVDDIANHFFGHLAKFVEEEADKFGYTVMFCNSENNEGKARNVLGTLVEKGMDGYIIAPTAGMVDELQKLVREKKPMVLVDRYLHNVPSNYVTIDNYKGAFESVDYLVKQGYRKIALVTNETEQIQIAERCEGYKAALRKHKIACVPERVKRLPFSYSEQKTTTEIERFLSAQKDVDAVLFTSNNLGIPGLQSLRNLGLKVAAHIGVICFDDHDLFRLGDPGITVVSQPIKTISKKVVKLLLDQIDGNAATEEHLVLASNLIVRDSTPLRL